MQPINQFVCFLEVVNNMLKEHRGGFLFLLIIDDETSVSLKTVRISVFNDYFIEGSM